MCRDEALRMYLCLKEREVLPEADEYEDSRQRVRAEEHPRRCAAGLLKGALRQWRAKWEGR